MALCLASHNSVAIPCVEYLMQRVAMVITLDLEWDF